jgi:3-oxoacyl-[acyl-carrier protein] reductase
MDLTDRVAVVTGTSQGIGRAIALDLGARGATVISTSRNLVGAEACAAEIRSAGGSSIALPLDVREEKSVLALADQLRNRCDAVDILVNNAGIAGMGSVDSALLEGWDEVISTNLTGPFLCAKYLAPLLAQSGRGSIINIGSVLGVVCMRDVAAYSAAKAGLHHLTKQTALDLASANIRANCVAPGFVRTEMFEQNHPEARKKRIPWLQAVPRVGHPAEIAYTVAFLASDLASFITGALILVDGGLTAQFGFGVIAQSHVAEAAVGE